MIGLGILVAADSRWRSLRASSASRVGVALWGLHMGFTQGVLAALVADTAPADLRGTAFGVFNLVSGIALLVASIVAGALWDGSGRQATSRRRRSSRRWRSPGFFARRATARVARAASAERADKHEAAEQADDPKIDGDDDSERSRRRARRAST